MYREESRVLKEELNTELKFRENHADLKRGKIEMTIQLAVVTMLSGIGGLLMGGGPRVIGSTPYQFWIGSSLVGVGVFLGIVVTPLTLVICYVWPKLSLSKKQ